MTLVYAANYPKLQMSVQPWLARSWTTSKTVAASHKYLWQLPPIRLTATREVVKDKKHETS